MEPEEAGVEDRVIQHVESREQLEVLPGPSSGQRAGRLPAFPAMLQRLRENRGLSKADLAKRTGLDPSTVTRFEQGTRQPERETVLQLADAMVLPMRERDLLLAAAGFRSEIWDDPLLVELMQLLNEDDIPERARNDARAAVRMAVAFLRLQRLQDD